MIQVHTAKELKDIDNFSHIARRHHLYVKGWTLFNWYTTYKQFIETFVLLRSGQTWVGAGVVIDWTKYYPINYNTMGYLNTGVFVKPPFRHLGLGKQIYAELKKSPIKLYHNEHPFYQDNFLAKVIP